MRVGKLSSNALRIVLLSGTVLATLPAALFPTRAQAQPTLEELERRLRGEDAGDEAPAPSGDKPYLGMTGAPLGNSGVRVDEVRPDGPAAKAGLRPGDVIVKIANQPIKTINDMAGVLDTLPIGANVEFTYRRAGANRTVTVTLAKRPDEPSTDEAPIDDAVAPAPGRPASLGVSLGPVTDELRAAHKLTVRRGAFILAIRPGSAADQAGLPLNGVIVAAEGRRIDDPQQVNDIVRAKRAGDEMLLSYYEGDKLFRKTVRLGEGASDGTAALPPLPAPPPDESEPPPDPPKPETKPTLPTAPRVGLKGDTAASLREEIAALRKLVERLSMRVEELEGRLKKQSDGGASKPSEDEAGPTSDGGDESAAEEELAPPKLRRPERPKGTDEA